jgi:signal transduction histidine kinase
VAGIFVDITEQKATEEALLRNEKLAAAARLAATMSHEINNPLAALTNLLYIVRGDRTLSRAGTQYLDLAQEELARVSRLAQQALGFYKEQSTASVFSVPELLDEVLALYSRNMPANIQVEKRYGGSVEVRGIRGEIWQVFANAISNAIYALSEGGTLTIEASSATRPGGAGMLVRISDTGAGISPENMKKIFQPFFTTKQKMGTGLGLWIAKDLVNKHGGSIDVESSTGETDHGTSIVVFLPAAAERIVAAGGGGLAAD